jgi:hypothetical protein
MNKNPDSPQIDFSLTTPVVCSNCGSRFFQPVLMFRTVPSVVSPTGKAMTVPVETCICVECRHINDEFDPDKRNIVE